MKKILTIGGMHCSGCASSLENLLELKGYKVKVDFDSKEAKFHAPKESDVEKIIKEIEAVGYKASNVHEGRD